MNYTEPAIYDAPFKRLSYFIAFTEHDLLTTLHQNGWSKYGLPYLETTLATTFQKWCDETRVNVVYFPIEQTAKCNAVNIGYIVHEGTHIVEDVLCRMGEEIASEEFRAYLTEEICENLISEFLLYIGVCTDD